MDTRLPAHEGTPPQMEPPAPSQHYGLNAVPDNPVFGPSATPAPRPTAPLPPPEAPFAPDFDPVPTQQALVMTDRRTGLPVAPVAPPPKMARWWAVLRPGMFWLSLLPLFLGTAIAWLDPTTGISAFFHPVRLVVFTLIVLAIHGGANLLGECYDALRGTNLPNGLGSSGILQKRLLDAESVGGAGLGLLGLGAVCLVVATLVWHAWGVLILGGGCVLLAYFYSATRYALSYFPLGELILAFVMGPALVVSAMQIQGAHVSKFAVTLSLALGALAAAVILANNLRDLETDRAANKRTLVTYVGAQIGRALYLAVVLLPYLLVALVAFPRNTPHGVLLVLLTLSGLVVAITGALRAETPAAMDVVVDRTLRLHTRFSLLLLVGYVFSILVPFVQHTFF